MLLDWKKGKIIEIRDETPFAKRFFIEVQGIDDFNFSSGQFVTLDLPIHEQKNKRWRSYSISSAPNGTNVFELIIVLKDDGAGSKYLFNEIEVGSDLTFRGPQGNFILPGELDKNLYLICTGTGIAPFRSMIQYLHLHQEMKHHDVHLIFGCRKFGDGLYISELKELEQKEKRFFFHPVYSREQEVADGMYKGYIHGVYEKLLAEEKEPSRFYLCGWKNMIDEAVSNILALGYDRKDIHLELYG
jgi:CDP-4-dehydro-6-deoxyglucose reductase